jgi:ABC-type polysaccharide/polyol phosphate transport system ATPase subunit
MYRADCVVRLEGITKTFPIERHRSTVFGSLRQRLSWRLRHKQTFDALRDIDLTVFERDRVGIVGNNGAGKSTLLKIIAGLYTPTAGRVFTRNEMSLLAGHGVGMVGDLTVEENVFLYGAIYGLSRKTLSRAFADIIGWAELRGFEAAKFKTLSAGMKTRLAFSVIRYIEPDIYLWDEALTAGDRNFQAKCRAVFEGYKQGGKTFLVASHDLAFVQEFCDKTLWLHKGRRKAFGATEQILKQYSQYQPEVNPETGETIARML